VLQSTHTHPRTLHIRVKRQDNIIILLHVCEANAVYLLQSHHCGFEEVKIFCTDDYYSNRMIHGRRKSLGVFDCRERVAEARVVSIHILYYALLSSSSVFCAPRADVIPKLYSTDNSNNGIETK